MSAKSEQCQRGKGLDAVSSSPWVVTFIAHMYVTICVYA